MTDIRTPDDEITKPGWFYPPFAPGRLYHGSTYRGHSPASVDFNRRTPSGGWLDDRGDPVLAPADGTVKDVDPAEGLVVLSHRDGWATEFRHMQDILVKKGDKVERGDRIGSIGDVAGSGRSTGPHLHMVMYRNGKRVPLRLEGKVLPVSVLTSDTKPATWDPPAPVAVVGPPPRATWKGAYEERTAQAEKLERQRDDARAQTKLATEERDTARAEVALLTTTVAELRTALTAAQARITELENATPVDCSAQVEAATRAGREAMHAEHVAATAAVRP